MRKFPLGSMEPETDVNIVRTGHRVRAPLLDWHSNKHDIARPILKLN